MSHLGHVLLVNPTITSRRSARFPLAVLNLAAALEGRYGATLIDGNIDRDFISTALRHIAPIDSITPAPKLWTRLSRMEGRVMPAVIRIALLR